MTAYVKCTVEKSSQTFYETHIAYQLALIHFTCKSNLQSELDVGEREILYEY